MQVHFIFFYHFKDTIRTFTYYNAIIQNHSDFKDKVVLDVGTGSGFLFLLFNFFKGCYHFLLLKQVQKKSMLLKQAILLVLQKFFLLYLIVFLDVGQS